jgi:hypothetical protein
MRPLTLLAALVAVLVSCTGGGATPSATSAATADIKRGRIDIVYSVLTQQDVHRVTSRKALQSAVDAIKAEAKRTGGSDDFPALTFEDVSEQVPADFKKFADAASAFAARNKQIAPTRFSDVAITGLITASPDCHTYYVNAAGAVFHSRPERTTGTPARIPDGTSLGGPDEAGLTGRMLEGAVAYITFRSFRNTGTYDIIATVRTMLDKAVAAGARAWLFDLRGNIGGSGTDTFASWFLNGEPTLTTMYRTGNGGTATAITALRLPDAYQLPIAIILNDNGGSGPEVFGAALKENGRATIVGQTSVGCLGGFHPSPFPDGGQIAIASLELVGGVSGTKYNNVGIPPDVPADDATAVAKAIEILKTKMGR